MSTETKEIPTTEDFRTAAAKSIPEAAAVFVHYARGLNVGVEMTKVDRYHLAEDNIQPATASEKKAIELARREMGLGN